MRRAVQLDDAASARPADSLVPRGAGQQCKEDVRMSKPNFVPVVLVAACLVETIIGARAGRIVPDARVACASDTFSICSAAIRGQRKVEDYLRQRASELSDACRSVCASGARPVLHAGKYQDRIAPGRF